MPEVSRVSEADYSALSTFLADFPDDETGSADAWLSRMRTWWDLNPAFDDASTRGWMLREEGEIVGFLGSIPWKFQLNGNETTVFGGTTWRVLPDYRGMSFALKRQQMDEQEDSLHISTTPRAEVERLLTRLGYAPMRAGKGEETHSVIVLNFEKWLRTKLKGRASGRIIAKRGARPLMAFQKLRMRRLMRCAYQKVRVLQEADASFDDLWQRTRTRYPSTHVRTAEAINWYCFSAPESRKTLLGYFDGDRLAGYMVLLPTDRRGMRILECVDVWIEPGPRREGILGALVEKARRCAEKASFDILHLPHFDRRTAVAYGRLGLLQRSAPRRPGLYMGPRELMHQLNSANSYIVLAEGDYGL